MTKGINRIFRLLFLFSMLSSIGLTCVDTASAAEGSAKEFAEKAYKAASAGKYDEAISYADKALQFDPNHVDVYNTRGFARLKKNMDSRKSVVCSLVAVLIFTSYYENQGSG